MIDSVGGLSRAGAIAGVTDETVGKWRDGKVKPPLLGIASIAIAAGRSVDWIIFGEEGGPELVEQGSVPPEFTLVPRLDVAVSAGSGTVVEVEEHADSLAFRSEWMRRRGINPGTAHALTARGDSMEPTIRDGDVLLVDTSIDYVKDNAIYVVVFAGRTLVKRLQLMRDGSVAIKSDNKDVFDDEVVPPNEVPDIQVAGRVMWYGRSI